MNPYPTTYAHHAGSSHTHHPANKISPFDGELQWEVNRAQMRAELEGLPSSFARTMFNQDDAFYATFPDARRAAIDIWIGENMQHGRYIPPASQNRHFVPVPSLPPAPPLAHTQQVLSPANHAAEDNRHAYTLVPRSSSQYGYGDGVDTQLNMSVLGDPRPSVRLDRDGATQDVYHLIDHSLQPFRPLPHASIQALLALSYMNYRNNRITIICCRDFRLAEACDT